MKVRTLALVLLVVSSLASCSKQDDGSAPATKNDVNEAAGSGDEANDKVEALEKKVEDLESRVEDLERKDRER